MTRRLARVWPAALLLSLGSLRAATVAPPLSLASLVEDADVVFKATALGDSPSTDAWFTTTPPRPAMATRLRPLAWYKGHMDGDSVTFHYWPSPDDQPFAGSNVMGHHLQTGHVYLVMARYAPETGQLRQLHRLWPPRSFPTVWDCLDKEPHEGATPAQAVWSELAQCVRQGHDELASRAVSLLRLLATRSGTDDYPVEQLVELLREGLYKPDVNAQREAIYTLGGRSWQRFAWPPEPGLATLGHGTLPGFGARRPEENEVAAAAWRTLAVFIDSQQTGWLRGMATQALADCREPALGPMVRRWAHAKVPEIVQCVPLLLANFAGNDDLVRELSAAEDPMTRRNAALAVAYGQFDSLLPRLVELLADTDANVRVAAAESLVSFPLAAHRDTLAPLHGHRECGFLFLNALAREDATPYLAELMAMVRDAPAAPEWWRGDAPWQMAWARLRQYAASRPADALTGEGGEQVLTALELPLAAGRDDRRFPHPYLPCQLYEVYLRHGLTDRAKAFRARCVKDLAFEVAKYFDEVDAAVAR